MSAILEKPVTIDEGVRPMDLAKLFRLLVRGKVSPRRDPKTCELMRETIAVIVSEYGKDGGPFEHLLPRLRQQTMSDLQVVAQKLEQLPVDRESMGFDDYSPLYYVLNPDGCWMPAYNAEDNRYINGYIVAGFRYKDGSTETYPAQLGMWADVDSDGCPSMPFVEW